jgi:hypothetical protein
MFRVSIDNNNNRRTSEAAISKVQRLVKGQPRMTSNPPFNSDSMLESLEIMQDVFGRQKTRTIRVQKYIG